MAEGNFYSEHLYQRSSKNTEALKKNVEDYPYSSLASFLLLYHYKKTADPDFEKFAKKTALHFNNQSWFQFLLYQKPFEKESEVTPQTTAFEEALKAAEFITETPAEIYNEQHFVKEIKQEELIDEKEEVPQNSQVISDNNHTENHLKTKPFLENVSEKNVVFNNDEKKTSEVIQPATVVQELSVAENENTNNVEETIAFDPLHTIDYFASQGIKLNEELITNDKLGSQMKSFTAWLKSMKKLHPAQLAEQSIVSEKLIQMSAEESNMDTDILTEAMAEVLIKQDKKDKAIDMFTKLSLINPAKSAYFAAKIESIKHR